MSNMPDGFIPETKWTNAAPPRGRVRVVGPNGERGTIPDPDGSAASTYYKQSGPTPPQWDTGGERFGWLPTAGGLLGDIGGALAAGAALPETGGMSSLAAPAIVSTGAGLGQTGGRALQLALMRAFGDKVPQNINSDLANNFASGAATSLVGQGLSGVARGIARPLMATAARTGDAAAVNTLLREGIAPGQSMMGRGTGSEQIERKLGSAISGQQRVLDEIGASGKTYNIGSLTRDTRDVVSRLRADAVRVPELRGQYNDLADRLDQFVQANQGVDLSPHDVQRIKRIFDEFERAAWTTDSKGKIVSTLTDREIAYNQSVANRARALLEASDSRVRPINQRIQGLMRAQPVMVAAEGKISQPHIGAVAAPSTHEGVPHIAAYMNPLAFIPQHPIGSGALMLHNRVAPTMRWLLPWGANYAAGTSK